ncbi:MAG: hypothetical protein GY760_26555 [Deltaproteobacteria bacterium]|nr:hypothetical protein [Deltaproteobacteria bacterium]
MKQTIWYDTRTGQKTVSYKKNSVMPEGMTDKKPLPNSEWIDGEWVVKRKLGFLNMKKMFKKE